VVQDNERERDGQGEHADHPRDPRHSRSSLGPHTLAAYRPGDTVGHGGRGVSTVFTVTSV
jgi:hypothetical protein